MKKLCKFTEEWEGWGRKDDSQEGKFISLLCVFLLCASPFYLLDNLVIGREIH